MNMVLLALVGDNMSVIVHDQSGTYKPKKQFR